MSPAAAYEDMHSSERLSGPALLGFWTRLWTRLPDVKYTIKHVAQGRDRSVIEWESSTTHPEGQVIIVDGVFVLDVRGGEIAQARVYYNPVVFRRIPTPGLGR